MTHAMLHAVCVTGTIRVICAWYVSGMGCINLKIAPAFLLATPPLSTSDKYLQGLNLGW